MTWPVAYDCDGGYSRSAQLGTLRGDRILPTWHQICVRGGRSQTGIGFDRTVEAGRSTLVSRHRAQERMSQQWRMTVQNGEWRLTVQSFSIAVTSFLGE